MSEETYYGTPVAPVNHGVMSTTGSVALGTAGGALKSVGKVAMWCIGIGAAVGLVWGAGLLPVVGLAGSFSLPAGFWSGIGGALLGVLGGGVAAVGLAPLAGALGAGKGALESHERVMAEKGAAQQMQAELQVARYQAMAASNDNKYNLAAQGSAMNPAASQIQLKSVQMDGPISGTQLHRA